MPGQGVEGTGVSAYIVDGEGTGEQDAGGAGNRTTPRWLYWRDFAAESWMCKR